MIQPDAIKEHIDTLYITRGITKLHFHHTAVPTKVQYRGEVTIESIRDYHKGVRGWQDIGYHYLVAPDGTIWPGRDINIDPASILNHNGGAVAVCVIGNFDTEVLEEAQRGATIQLVLALLERFKLTTGDIMFHRDYAATSCPGSSISRGEFVNWVEGWQRVVKKQPSARLMVDGKEIEGAAELRDGKLWVWARGFAEAMGARVDWDAATKTAHVDSGKRPKLPAYHARFDGHQYNVITAAPEQLEVAMIRGLLKRNGINGGFLDGQLNPLGVVVINGETVAERVQRVPPRPVFWLRGGIAGITVVDAVAEMGGVDFAVGGGPSLLPRFNPENGQYQPDIMSNARERTAVGITGEGLVKLVVTEPVTMSELVAVMTKEGCKQSMALDGGGSTAMVWDGKTVRGNKRANCTAILLREG